MSVAAVPELVRASIAGQTDRGKVREDNRGTVHHATTKFGDLLVVANGIGDGAGGSQASRIAVDMISSGVAGMLAFFPPEIAVEEAVRQANTELIAASATPEGVRGGMGVAVVVALLRMDTDRARVTIGHVGDSRAYLVRKRKLTLLTGDEERDFLAGQSVSDRQEPPHRDRPTPTPCLGHGLDIKVATNEIQLEAGDTLLLCSDGLWRSVAEQDIERALADQTHSAEEDCHTLLDLALDAGGRENVAVEIARLTQSGDPTGAATHAIQNQSEVPQKIAAQPDTPAIEWPAPEPITYGSALGNDHLNATASVPGTFQYNPRPGAMLSAGEHTLSVVFTPSHESDFQPAQATVRICVAKATPTISWPAPDPINSATPLGSAQLNARASIPGSFAYRPAAGAMLEAGAHTLAVTFSPADSANYSPVEANVSLTVIDSIPAAIAWPSPSPIAYGTGLGEEQLCATTTVPGSFVYIPGPGNVLPPGKHELSVLFTPDDRIRYTETRTSVTLVVEELPIVVPVLNRALPTPLAAGAAAEPSLAGVREPDEVAAPFAHTLEAEDAENEIRLSTRMQDDAEESRSKPEPEEKPQEEMVLFRSFQSDSESERGQKRASKWLTIGSVVLAIPILCVLVFLVDKAHSGAPFIEHHSSQAAPPAGDVPQQSDTQDPSHGVKITVDQPSAGTGTQSTVNSQPGAENAPRAASSSRSDENETGGPGDEPTGRTSVNDGGTEPIDREGASSPVTVSADDAAKQLMESRTPIYPPGAKASGVAGTVELEGTISKDGTVKDLRVVSGPAELRQAALNSVRAWRYRPFMVNNEPAEVQTTMNVVFSPNE